MFHLALIAFLAIVAVNVWTVIAVRTKASQFTRRFYFAVVVILVGVACWTTFGYEYYWNENTRFCGWPVPMMVFQRDDANSPWLDFVGPTLLFGLPMNAAIFLFGPSLVFLITAYVQSGKTAN